VGLLEYQNLTSAVASHVPGLSRLQAYITVRGTYLLFEARTDSADQRPPHSAGWLDGTIPVVTLKDVHPGLTVGGDKLIRCVDV
jgi:hypothetical protein